MRSKVDLYVGKKKLTTLYSLRHLVGSPRRLFEQACRRTYPVTKFKWTYGEDVIPIAVRRELEDRELIGRR